MTMVTLYRQPTNTYWFGPMCAEVWSRPSARRPSSNSSASAWAVIGHMPCGGPEEASPVVALAVVAKAADAASAAAAAEIQRTLEAIAFIFTSSLSVSSDCDASMVRELMGPSRYTE